MNAPIFHTASEVRHGLQHCVRCGYEMIAPDLALGEEFWKPGTRVYTGDVNHHARSKEAVPCEPND